MAAPTFFPERRDLYRWQLNALVAWLECGRRGVIEAVTGSGKTDVAIAAAIDARRRGLFVLVVVPSRVLLEQWFNRLQEAMPDAVIGRLGDSGVDTPGECDVLVSTRHSAASHRPVPPGDRRGLLIADECHGFGGGVLRKALLTPYDERLGLTATMERSDGLVTELLLPYFGGLCYRYGFVEAIADGVCAQPRVAFVGVALSVEERAEYVAFEQQLVNSRQQLRKVHGIPLEPFGEFLAAVSYLADHDSGADGRAARDYLDAFGKRRQIVASSSGKYELLGRFASTILAANGALIFTETVRAANHAINRLDPLVSIDIITGSTARGSRREILGDLRSRKLDAVVAPRVLDEGVDVPDANLGIVMSASRTRRQMIQRMGRILRRKQAGVGARFVIMFAKDTIEDPSMRLDRDGFVEEIEQIAQAAAVFDGEKFELVDRFLDYFGPVEIIEPARLGPFEHTSLSTDAGRPTDAVRSTESPAQQLRDLARGDQSAWQALANAAERDRELAAHLLAEVTQRLGHETVYAYLHLLTWDRPGVLHELASNQDAALPKRTAEYLDPEVLELPAIAKPKTPPKRLSTGDRPLQLASVGSAWILRCTGCSETSPPAKFSWQALELTVVCRCA